MPWRKKMEEREFLQSSQTAGIRVLDEEDKGLGMTMKRLQRLE